MSSWHEINAWRRAKRAELLSRRLAVPRGEKPLLRSTIHDILKSRFPELRHHRIGFYWPIKGEIDLRHLVQDFMAEGAAAALPVVVEKRQPLEFWVWQPDQKLQRGFWNIPVPAEPNRMRPTALLIPLVGFDGAGYRLGYGGGYYDRTLAGLNPKPLTIGVGYDFGRLESIQPQPHDIPLDAIVTETGCTQFRYRGAPIGCAEAPSPGHDLRDQDAIEAGSYASPPCFLHELDPAYLGFLSTADTLALLKTLLEGAQDGADSSAALAAQAAEDDDNRAALHGITEDQRTCCATLRRHLTRLGGSPGAPAEPFLDEVMAGKAFGAQIAALKCAQTEVLGKLEEALPMIGDAALHRDLAAVATVLQRTIGTCMGLGAAPD